MLSLILYVINLRYLYLLVWLLFVLVYSLSRSFYLLFLSSGPSLMQGGVIIQRCYGCGRCLSVCPYDRISEHLPFISFFLIFNHQDGLHDLVNLAASSFPYNLLCMKPFQEPCPMYEILLQLLNC
jgi:ferredoxin